MKDSDIYSPVRSFRIYIERPVTYTLRSCVSGFTLKGQWHILPRHVFRDLLWKTSDIYSPVMCFGIYIERPARYALPSCVSGFTLKDQWYILHRHVFRDFLGQTSDIYYPSKSRNTWRGNIYHWSFNVNPETQDGGVYILLPRHVFRYLLWNISDTYFPVMCFRIYFERPVIYTPPSCVSGFTLTDQWYILPRHVFRDSQ
jgi:hypothetical protein